MRRWYLALIGGVFLASLMTIALAREAGGLPDDYWTFPLPPQGTPPAAWTPLERSLRPADCGACHADRYREWRSSVHARAFSAGLFGQLVALGDEPTVAACLNCHAPLFEQREQLVARLRGTAADGPSSVSAHEGVSCAACHVRSYRRHGPPPRIAGHMHSAPPHGGFEASSAFERSAFCAACHQFPLETAVNGKPLENVVVEWQASRYAAEGITCQGCHMPDRRHLFRGIHDPEMVAAGLAVKVSASAESATITVANSGVGHAFPTYSTPKVIIRACALGDAGRSQGDECTERIIQREIRFDAGQWIEIADTRLMPGETAVLTRDWSEARAIRFTIDVLPDELYHRETFPELLKELTPGSRAAALIEDALRAAKHSHYRLFEHLVERPG